MSKTQQEYENILIEILDDKHQITIEEFIDFLEKRDNTWNEQQIVRNIISNRKNNSSPFSNGILNYNESTGIITKNR